MSAKKPISKTVFISGNFIVLHPGHLRLFQFAKDIGQKLIVGVIADKYQAIESLVPEQMRLEGVINNVLVDEAIIIDEPIHKTLRRLRPDIVLKGKEHEDRENKELEALDEYGGQLVFSSGETEFSTLNLLASKFLTNHAWTREVPEEYQLNHQIELNNIKTIIEKFGALNVAVIGDLIIDEYIDCQPLGMSQEDPCLAVTPIQSHRYIGGAGIVALHAAGLGANTHFLSTTGDDELHDYAHEKLSADIDVNLIKDVSRPTTLKQRYRAKNSSLLRVSHLHQNSISLANQDRIKDSFLAIVNGLDLLVFSDFNYGCLPNELVTELIQIAKQNGVFIAADSQSSSQVGNIGRFEGVDLITPTEREVRVSLHDNQSGLVVLADKLSNMVGAQNVFLKMGEDGVLVYNNHGLLGDAAMDSWTTDILPGLNIAPKDVAGAGDSMLISGSMALAVGASIWEAALIGSHVAALQVSRVGNTPVSATELLELIER